MLVALHGFTENDLTWSGLLSPQIPNRCPVLPGHGWRPCPAASTLATVAAEMAGKLQPGDDLLGYSLGGRVALQTALDHPQRVRRLILVSCSAGIVAAADRADRQARDERLAQILEEDGISPFVAWWESNPALKTAQALDPRCEEALRSTRLNQDPLGLAGVLRTLSQGLAVPVWNRLPTLSMPVLLIAGAQDRTYRQRMADMAKVIPQATLLTIPGAGHAVHREQPTVLKAAVREFLA